MRPIELSALAPGARGGRNWWFLFIWIVFRIGASTGWIPAQARTPRTGTLSCRRLVALSGETFRTSKPYLKWGKQAGNRRCPPAIGRDSQVATGLQTSEEGQNEDVA